MIDVSGILSSGTHTRTRHSLVVMVALFSLRNGLFGSMRNVRRIFIRCRDEWVTKCVGNPGRFFPFAAICGSVSWRNFSLHEYFMMRGGSGCPG